MAGVPQKTLNWLWDVLRREYRDPQRTYSDLAQTLAQYPGFAPRTDVYTFEHGAPALLLQLNGTVPVEFRGSTYRFPVAVWVPHNYPYESPIAYVTPTDDMVIRPGQHVSAADGRIYHPYLARWRDTWARSNIVELLKLMADAFAREPPVMAKQQMPSRSIQQGQNAPPPRPPPPGDERRYSAQSAQSPSLGPPPPPKQFPQENGSQSPVASPASRPGRYDAPPPLPHEMPNQVQQPSSNARQTEAYDPNRHYSQPLPQRQGSIQQPFTSSQMRRPDSRYHQSPSLPQAQTQPQSAAAHSLPPQQSLPPQPSQAMPQPHPYQQQQQQQQQQQYPAAHPVQQHSQAPPFQSSSQQQQQQQSQAQYYVPPQQPQQTLPMQPKPPQDLLDDSPFDVSLPKPETNLPTPIIPPNPEKAAVLNTLSSTMLQILHSQIQQSHSALPALQSQNAALAGAHQQLNHEMTHLQSLQTQISQNITALNQTMSSADRTIASAKQDSSSQNKIPGIDELIIPPTVVARQIYDAVAEQRGYEAAIFALTEGFVRGRIGSEMWGRKTRECAREEFRRKWLVKRVGRGMGLDMNEL